MSEITGQSMGQSAGQPTGQLSGSSASLSWFNVIKLAGAYCAFCIGSGFASGQEIRLFFTSQGLMSFGALAISMALFMWFGSAIMMKGYALQLQSANTIFRQYCGRIIGGALEIFVPIFIFSVVVIMIAGAGATLSEYYGLPPYVGRILMAAVSIVSIIFGLGRLVYIIGMIGPVIIIISIIVGGISISTGTVSLAEVDQIMKPLNVPQAATAWYISGTLYAAFMVLGSAPFFSGLGTQANSHKEALLGGLLGGFLLIGAAAVMSTGMLCNITELFDKEVPALALANGISPILANFFALILILGIYSTAAPMLWSVCNRIAVDSSVRFKLTACVLGTLALFGGLLPFSQLVGFIYPKTGVIGIGFMLAVLLSPLWLKRKK